MFLFFSILALEHVSYGGGDLLIVALLPLDIGEHRLQGLLYGLFEALQRGPVLGDEPLEVIEIALQECLLRNWRQQARHVLGNGMIAMAAFKLKYMYNYK